MGMLNRIKRQQFDGFKEFVANMETTAKNVRQQIFVAGTLEDPIFMAWIFKNLKNFDDFLNLPSDEIGQVLDHQDQVISVFAKCMFGLPEEKILSLDKVIPKHFSKLRDEISYLKEVTPREKEAARYFILKIVRKLQGEETIGGFSWLLPPQDIFYPKTFKDGPCQLKFESGVLAAEGEVLKGQRTGLWKHFFDSGKLLAEGEYLVGLKNGLWTFYYSTGGAKSKGRYHDDLKEGQWQEWDRNGIVSEITYLEGVKKKT
jgi:hypothetical protein